jgi:hypothetical protein
MGDKVSLSRVCVLRCETLNPLCPLPLRKSIHAKIFAPAAVGVF